MASYPTSVWNPTTKTAGQTIDPAHMNDAQAEIVAIEAGLTQGTAPLNSSNSTLANLTVSGGSTLATLQVTGNSTFGSSMTIGTVPYTWPTSGPSSGQVLTVASTNGSTAVLAWRAPVQPWVHLHSSTGTDTSAGAATVDSVALSGLTPLDTVRVTLSMESSSQATAQVSLYSVTDSVIVGAVTGATIGANAGTQGEALIRMRQGNSTGYALNFNGAITGGTAFVNYNLSNMTTAWTGSWTLGLRHTGVTAGGTFKYGWSVYKQAGQ